ncbi:class I SAM-dependent methyltransferase [Luteimonas fraxinea]|uniref:Class I SAM-dependent methyltransferase n=1 Tax=Luteimonas fraxinea TaxID=2901869 RepID=A0ABS8UIP9_9GAMM|nr:class I SAM-dependent methyltransferase [Luteimonas fraxinea]MCD9098591.1 class I SAM-dependent methyltransferase [Luteimonas fraxinea]MCD9127324.1 class I SAM-dependent methyltransferase [Luteimonas fraxinea]UHH09006.1 class I SAM-dependent methyltransferase [Luteimonas fraxinea]
MAQKTDGLRAVLSHPAFYDFLQTALGAGRARARMMSDHIRPRKDDRVLDIGCGTAELLPYFPVDIDYVGFDLSSRYIDAARKRYGDRGRFECMDVADFQDTQVRQHGADLVLAIGILHHLDDDQARSLINVASSMLRPGGRFISMDGTLVAGQSAAARGLILRDRGQNIREPDGYAGLATGSFTEIKPVVRHDLLYVPYTHCILECTR